MGSISYIGPGCKATTLNKRSSLLLKKKLLLIIYSPPCHPRHPCHSFFSQKEIKVFDKNIPGFFSI